jgi:hypothetical protein
MKMSVKQSPKPVFPPITIEIVVENRVEAEALCKNLGQLPGGGTGSLFQVYSKLNDMLSEKY